jgi:low temperature requirement protein LtrA
MFPITDRKEFIVRLVYTISLILATVWLIGQTGISYYMEVGQDYLSDYLSEAYDGQYLAGMILSHMIVCSILIIICVTAVWLLKSSRDKVIMTIPLIIISFAILFVFRNQIYNNWGQEVSETPWIFLSVVGSIAVITGELYFSLIRPFIKKRSE